MKKCNKCDEIRPFTDYKSDPRNKSGLQGICKICNKAALQQLRFKRVKEGPTKLITVKTCNKCNETKQTSEFFRDTGTADMFATICKVCKTAVSMQWRSDNREQYNANQRIQHAKNYERNRLYRYDLTPEEYQQMLKDQDNKCAICAKPPQGVRPLVIDHDHDTGAVRQLLCYGCNRALHILEETGLLDKALIYLEKHDKAK